MGLRAAFFRPTNIGVFRTPIAALCGRVLFRAELRAHTAREGLVRNSIRRASLLSADNFPTRFPTTCLMKRTVAATITTAEADRLSGRHTRCCTQIGTLIYHHPKSDCSHLL